MSSQLETFTKFKSNKTLSTNRSKKTFLTQVNLKMEDIKKFFFWFTNKINYFLSKCSMLTHFIIVLIPISFLFIFLIFFIHLTFYDRLFCFNYYKGVKEEFVDSYITEIDDMQSEIDAFIIEENYLDVENINFFEIYFIELASIGILDNSTENIFPDIHYESNKIYQDFDNFYKGFNVSGVYSIPEEQTKEYIDERNDSFKEIAKIYFYMFPIINYGLFVTKVIIDQTFLIAYEFNNDRNIIGNELFFTFPRNSFQKNEGYNFKVNHGYLNPLVSRTKYEHFELINNSYYKENFFEKQDYDFRLLSNLSEENWSYLSFVHSNYEENGNITKNLMITFQLNINRNNRHFIINIIYVLKQNDINDENIKHSAFILRNDSAINNYFNKKYSDNETFVLSQQDFTEYSLSTIDSKYFHYGLFDKNYNFYKNGVSFDSFNLGALSNPFNYYSTVEGFNYDLKYLSTLFLYAKMLQNVESSKYKKEGEEISLNSFSDEEKVKNICKSINLTNYIEYLKEDKDINCWDSQNELYYSIDDYKKKSLFDSYTSLPFCACLPLYCLDNYKTLKKDNYKFTDNNFVSQINLPDRCQPKYDYYLNEKDPKFSSSYQTNISQFVYYLFNDECKTPEKEYIKITKEDFNQLPGYSLLVFSGIKSNTQTLFFQFFNTVNKIEIITIILITLLFVFILIIVIIYKNLKKYSLIIEEFTQKYENFVYHSKFNDIDMMHQEDNRNNEQKKNYQNNNNQNIPFLRNEDQLFSDLYNNDNYLIEELFTIFCKYYNISRKQLEKYYLQKAHETKFQMKLKMMNEKNELFKLLCMFSIYAPFFRLNLNLEYKVYKYSKIIKKYNQYVTQVGNMVDKEQTKLTKNILYELLSTENISDYGLVMNLNFKYISNINAENKENSIQYALFKNIINNMKGKNEDNENDININDIFFIIKDGDEKQNVKLVLKKKNELMELFKNKFENDDYLHFNKIDSSFNFFLINSYYKYLKQISLEENKNN